MENSFEHSLCLSAWPIFLFGAVGSFSANANGLQVPQIGRGRANVSVPWVRERKCGAIGTARTSVLCTEHLSYT